MVQKHDDIEIDDGYGPGQEIERAIEAYINKKLNLDREMMEKFKEALQAAVPSGSSIAVSGDGGRRADLPGGRAGASGLRGLYIGINPNYDRLSENANCSQAIKQLLRIAPAARPAGLRRINYISELIERIIVAEKPKKFGRKLGEITIFEYL